MKICDLTQSYNPTSGGIRTYLHEKRRYLKKLPRHEHILIVPGEKDEMVKEENLTIYCIKSPVIPRCEPYRFILRVDKVFSILRKTKPNIIELGSAYLLPHVVFLYRLFFPVTLLGFYHTDFPTAYVYPAMHKVAGKHVAWFCRFLVEKYARLIYNRFQMTFVCSQLMKEKLERMEIRNIKRINLGVDINVFHPGKKSAAFRREQGIKNEEILFIYTGRLDSEKRIDVLLQAFEQVSDKVNGKLILIGEGPYKDLVQRYEKQNSKIKLLPYENDRHKLAKFLASSDIYLTAGPHETFGLSIVEAQSCGLPVIGVDGGALAERVNSTVGALGAVDSIEAFRDNILALSVNGYKQKGINARKLVEENYNWQHTLSKLMAYYEKLHRRKVNRPSLHTTKMFSLGSRYHSGRHYS
ncbi:glycosyltransferase [candidate division KSB1 bacterium]|nr:glycosyltransferase [candidate division KSB1 bacterium]